MKKQNSLIKFFNRIIAVFSKKNTVPQMNNSAPQMNNSGPQMNSSDSFKTEYHPDEQVKPTNDMLDTWYLRDKLKSSDKDTPVTNPGRGSKFD